MDYLTIEDDGLIYSPDDKDGDKKYEFGYVWDFDEDGFSDWEYPEPGGTWPGNPECLYGEFNFSGHVVSVRVTDRYGKESITAQTLVYVMPTKTGRLNASEEWKVYYDGSTVIDAYAIIGDVYTGTWDLTIREGVRVIVMGEYGMFVENGGCLSGSEDITIRFRDDLDVSMSLYWKGIKVENGGNISLDNVRIMNAERGVTVEELLPGDGADPPTPSVFANTIFESNKTALHVLGKTQILTNCEFIRNRYYALKEDAGADFEPVNCLFFENGLDKSGDGTGNYYDYYDHETRTVLRSVDENSGE